MKKIELAFIIDDDQVYVMGLKQLINIQNYCKNLMVFENGEEALKYLRPFISNNEHLPDVILLDINMPVMDGWQFLEEFIKIEPLIKKKITIYMLSSSINPSDIQKARSYSEVSDYFVKPIELDDLQKVFG